MGVRSWDDAFRLGPARRAARMNPHQLADYAIQVGAVPLDGRQAILDEFATDPVHTVSWVEWVDHPREPMRPLPRDNQAATTWGNQPCKRGRPSMLVPNSGGYPEAGYGVSGYPSPLPAVCEQLSALVGFEVSPRRLRAWIDGCSVPPAEIKLGLAQVLGMEPEECWTQAVMEATYSGPRGQSKPAP